MRLRRIAPLLVLAAVFLFPAAAFAYNEGGTVTSSLTACTACHGATAGSPTTGTVDTSRSGPHGNYTTTSSKCGVCHSVHQASSANLLPAATASAACATCHDGTGGNGVYGVILARTGLPPAAQHRVDTTNIVPGGSATTGGAASMAFSGPGNTMSCDDCHSPHAALVVTAFTTDRLRTASYETTWNGNIRGFVSSALLKQRPGAYTGTPIMEYGSNWCGACHQGRLVNVGVSHTHPVESTATAVTPTYNYRNLPIMSTDASGGTVALGAMGRTNRGLLMLNPGGARSGLQVGHLPICQQCHADPRDVGNLAADGATAKVTPFAVTSPNGGTLTDNPRFQVFPHESTSTAFLVEQNDGLCINCHAPGQLR